MSTQNRSRRKKAEIKQRVPLALADGTFWAVLFPDSPTRAQSIENWVSDKLVDAGNGADICHPSRASATEVRDNISVQVVDKKVNLQVLGQDRADILFEERLGSWLAMQTVNPSWREMHPIVALRARPADKNCVKQVEILLQSAVILVQHKIDRHLVQALRSGQLTALAVETGRPLDGPRRVPAELFMGGTRLETANNQILPQFGGPLTSVTIEGPTSAPDSKPTSFKDADHLCFIKMRELVVQGHSVSEAARMVEPGAEHRDKSSPASVVERLRRGYKRWLKDQNAAATTRKRS